MRRRLLVAVAAVLAVASAHVVTSATPAGAAATLPAGFNETVIAAGLSFPTTTAYLPDGRMLITEKRGTIRVVQNGTLVAGNVADLQAKVNNYWDRGLTGIAVDPAFATNGFVYLFYPYDIDGTDSSAPTTDRITRITLSGNTMVAGSETIILGSVVGQGCATTSSDCIPADWYGHGADTLTFAPDGTLFVSMGDASSWDYIDDRALRVQDVNQYPGKVLHIDTAGRGLATNPFWDGNAASIRSKVYAYGLRNPFRLNMRPGTTTAIVGDVGEGTYEELNNVKPGANFGWPCYEGPDVMPGFQSKPICQALYAQGPGAVTNPIYSYPHSGTGAAIVGGSFTPSSSNFPALYQGGMFFADYARSLIRYAQIDASGAMVGAPVDFATSAGGPVNVSFAPDGSMTYVAILDGEVRRVAYTGSGNGGSGSINVSTLPTTGTPINGYGPFERDHSNGDAAAGDGGTMRMTGVAFQTGLGVHANSDLRFTIPAGCTSFSAQVGVDDEATGPGTVQFEVWDGTSTRLYQSAVKHRAEAPSPVNVALGSATTLRLVVTDAGDNNYYDHADWGSAQLQCATQSAPPTISGVGATATASSATVTWTTSTPSSSRVEYGTATSYGSLTMLDPQLVTSHSQVLSGLAAATTYHYRVRSIDALGQEAISGDNIVTTSSTSGASTIAVSGLPTTGTPVNGWGPFERDRSNGEQGPADGTTLRIAGTTYPTGLGVHAASDIRFTVPAGCTTFTAQVGVDGEVGANGSVGFEVWNGTTARLYQSPVKHGGEAATAVSASLSGVTTLRLVVTDGGDGNSYDHADWASATLTCGSSGQPVVTITSPAAGQAFKVGDTISLVGSGTESNGAALPANSLQWQVNILHCPFGGACHTHPLATFSGATASFIAPDHGDDSHMQVILTGTGASGATASTNNQLEFQTVPLTLTTSPPGLQVLYGGVPVTTPFTTNAVVGGTRTIEAPLTQGSSTFASWSDGGAAQHNITIGTTAMTRTATYSGGTGTTVNVSTLSTTGTPVNGWGPFERDRSNGEQGAADGHTLQIGATTFTTGLGVHAASDIRFTVPAGCTTFTAQVGIDNEVGANGSVVFEVWNGTATRLYQSPVKRGGNTATAVSVPLTGVTTLRLVVTNGGDNLDYDHGDWADAKLTCS